MVIELGKVSIFFEGVFLLNVTYHGKHRKVVAFL